MLCSNRKVKYQSLYNRFIGLIYLKFVLFIDLIQWLQS